MCRHPQVILGLGLPRFRPRGLFPKQQEICVKGALFPQFILGIEIITQGRHYFMANPHALTLSENQYEDVVRSGIPIDQHDFPERIRETSYNGWVERETGGRFRENLLNKTTALT